MSKQDARLVQLAVVFSMALVASNFLASKIIQLGPVTFPASVLAFAITFMITDTVSEVWGRSQANTIVSAGFIASLMVILLVQLAIVAPPASFWPYQDEYAQVVGSSVRITLASMCAYLVSQYHDIWLFHAIRERRESWITSHRGLAVRNNISTIASQALDQFIFVSIAFAGSVSFPELVSMIVGGYLVKVFIALLDTVPVYGLVHWAERP